MLFTEELKHLWNPPILAERENFLIKLAETESEVEEALRLRYHVFKGEQGRLVDLTDSSCDKDEDEFDPFCLHLIIVDRSSHRIVGTYRVHPGVIAVKNLGFYSAREYHVDGLDRIALDTIEVGRSCVSPDFRNGAVVALLWSGLAEIYRRTRCAYLCGCVSMETTDPNIGWAMYRYLQGKNNYFTDRLHSAPQEAFVLPQGDPAEIEALLTTRTKELQKFIPPLLMGYLRLGAKLTGLPALDRDFGSIDFLMLLTLEEMQKKYAKHFL